MSKVTEVVEQLALPVIEQFDLQLIDIEFVKEGRDWFLRVYIDKENGVDIEDCALVSEQLSAKLDEEDPIPQNYFLEVSSPGAERPLKTKQDLKNSIGKNIFVKTYAPIEDEKAFEGKLLSFDDEILTLELTIKTRKKLIEIQYDMVANARLAVTFS